MHYSLQDSRVAIALLEHRELKPSKANVELVREATQSRCFVPLKSVLELRESTRNVDIPGKVDYMLNDGSWVAIDVDSNKLINTIIEQQGIFDQVINMTENRDVFLTTVRRLIKEHHGN